MPPSTPSKLAHPLVSYRPLSLFYRLAKLLALLPRLPLWFVRAAVPALRPVRSWTFKQTLMRYVLLHAVDIFSHIGITETLRLEPGREGARWARLAPHDDALYVGPLLSDTVRPAPIGGTWYGVPAAPQPQDPATAARTWTNVALHLHGGAFVMGDGRDAATGYLGRTLVGRAGFDAVFAPQYRLAGYGGRDPFPAALQDALTAYLYLVRTLGVPPAAVTLSGDSAGGNLAIALLRYLERFGAQLPGGGVPMPGRVVLLSPWVRPGAALHTPYGTWDLARTDFLPVQFIKWGAEAYLLQTASSSSSGGDAAQNEWVDALGAPFTTDVPVFLSWADREILRPDCEAWAEEMRAASEAAWAGMEGDGWKFVTNVERDAPHDTLLIADQMGWEKSAEEVAGQIKKFVEETTRA